MKVVVAGSRTLDIEPNTILNFLEIFHVDIWSEEDHEVIAGGCPTGPDRAAKELPKYIGIHYKEFPADWEKYGKSAGPRRNKEMAEYGEMLLLIWDGESRGSASMKREMKKLNKPIFEVIIKRS